MLQGFYEIGGSVHLLSRGEYLRIQVGVTMPEMEPAARSALASVSHVLNEANRLGLFIPSGVAQIAGEILLTIRVIPAHHTQTLDQAWSDLAKQARERLELAMATGGAPMPQIDDDEEEWVQILPDDIVDRMAVEGVA